MRHGETGRLHWIFCAVLCVSLSLLTSAWAEAVPASPSPTPTASPAQSASPAPLPSSSSVPRKSCSPEYELGGQVTIIRQNLYPFHSQYQAGNSLPAQGDARTSDKVTLFTGLRFAPRVDGYVDVEMARGGGVNQALGLGTFTNGDVTHTPSLTGPYLARAFVRWTMPTGGSRATVSMPAAENQIAGVQPAHRLVITAGKLALTDLFDVNSYANSTKTQFLNWALINNPAYDFAADTQGYSTGLALEWAHPDWAVRAGSYFLPSMANANNLSWDLAGNRSDNLEIEIRPDLLGRRHGRGVVRLLLYRNLAQQPVYGRALDLAGVSGQAPRLVDAVQRVVQGGICLNLEQPLGDQRETGLFARLGWKDGQSASVSYMDCDRAFSLGAQISGRNWGRPHDRIGTGIAINGLSGIHSAYLAAGGMSSCVGDGRLTYGTEQIWETYYSFQATRALALALDFQQVRNPGYNRDRGPASVFSVRMHLEY